MGNVAREGVSVVAMKLIESLVENDDGRPIHEGRKVEDVPVFTAEHESRLHGGVRVPSPER